MIHNVRPWNSELLLFGIAFLFRLLIFLTLLWWSSQAGFMYPLQGSDANGYWILSSHIVTEGTYYTEDKQFLSLRRTPGYPLFLTPFRYAFGNTSIAHYGSVLLQLVLAALSIVILYRLLQHITTEKIARWAAILFALEPNSAYYSTLLLSDTLFMFLFLASVYIFLTQESHKSFFLSGCLLGMAMLVRPIAQFFPAIAAFYLLYAYGFKRRIFVHIATFFMGTMLLTIPWMMYNNTVAGSFILSSSGPHTYYQYVMPHFISWYTGEPYQEIQRTMTVTFNDTVAAGNNSVVFMQQELARIVSKAPFSYAIFHIVKTAPFFLGDGIREILQRTHILTIKQPNISSEILHGNIKEMVRLLIHNKYLLLAIFGGVFWSIVLLLAVIGFWRGIHNKNQRPFVIFFAAVILYLALLTGPATSTRHRMPALPFIAGLASMGAAVVISKRRKEMLRVTGYFFTHKHQVIRNIFHSRNP
jgi:4-amino-4-deoxy-L-arabinose transferase-like glycosyltransferase